ncbi:MAG: DNA polymerase I [Xanthomonadaceae bacterium]|nr:DNA polymerase I [Xanthomonadaceae bacterium]
MAKTFLVVDGSNFLFRAFHALPPLKSPDGRPTGAIRGVITMFNRLLNEFNPDYLAVVFDAKGKSFRSDLYPDYKAHRPPMPDDLREQIAPLYSIIDMLGYPRLIIDGIEADDVIATLAVRAKTEGIRTIIASSDKDLAQLVEDGVITMYDGMKNEMLDRETVFEKYGVYPELVRDYLSLMGDKADNIPGIPGVGPKTAAKWLNEHGSLDNIIANAESFKGKVGERLRENLDLLPLSKELTTLYLEADVDLTFEDLKPKDREIQRLKEIYPELGFRQLLMELDNGNEGATFAPPPQQGTHQNEALGQEWIKPRKPDFQYYHRITTEKALHELVERCQNVYRVALDTETDSLDSMQANLVGISIAVAAGEAFYIPFKHEGLETELTPEKAVEILTPMLVDNSVEKVGQNIKFDWHVLARYGAKMEGIKDDTMLASYILNPTKNRHNMDVLADLFLDHKTTSFESIAGKGKSQKTFDEIDIETAEFYACEDADITLQLQHAIVPQLKSFEKQYKLYEEVEIPLLPVLAKMEHQGILVDAEHLKNLQVEFGEKLDALEAKAFELAGEEFNLGSSKQVGEILFDKLGLPVLRKTPGGKPSTNEAVLSELALDYPLPKLILEHREFSKLSSTYTDSLIAQINPDTKRIHTSFNQALTSTGRLSSSEPNLQNIPIRTAEGRRIREAFIAPDGFKLLSADYSQIELRLMAHFSEDETLLNAFLKGHDIHSSTASEVFKTPLDKVSSDERRAAKAINFGLIYGMGAFGLARQLGISRGQAQEYISLYFSRYPGVLAYMDRAKEQAKDQGYVETLLGRRLYLPEITGSNGAARAGAERVAINAPLQGTAADIIKLAMLRVDQTLTDNPKLNANLLLQVHDELILEVSDGDLPRVTELLERDMTKVFELKVPLLVDVGIGKNWDGTAN